MDYHREYLNRPGEHGLRIETFTTADGTPCLVCTPAGKLGERGEIIRRQLTDRGSVLAPFGQIRGTLVLVHGRKGRKEDYLPIAERLVAAGFRCVIPDMPAHGDHPGKIATYGIREACIPGESLKQASRKFRFDAQPAGLFGISMGGSVSLHASGLADAPWRALVIVASFDSLSSVVDDRAGRHLGTTAGSILSAATREIFLRKTGVSLASIRPISYASSLRIPVLIAHGTEDLQVSTACGRRLFDAVPTTVPSRWVEIQGADHDNVLITSHPIYADIAEWMIRYVVEP